LTQPSHLITHQVDGITGYHEFPSLAEDYESRAQKYREAPRALGIWFPVKISDGIQPQPAKICCWDVHLVKMT
jgi:hypothetical protein